MILPEPDFIPDLTLERRALALLKTYERERSQAVRLPVPITKILEYTLKLKVVAIEIEDSPDSMILARIDPDYYGVPTIQLNERRLSHFESYFGTEAFSLAHEGGHWVLHLDRGRSSQPAIPGLFDAEPAKPVLCRLLSAKDRREFQAERFAAYLLMPEHLIVDLIRGEKLTDWKIIAHLAHDCGVSKTAFRRRLEELNKIGLLPNGAISIPAPPQEGLTWI